MSENPNFISNKFSKERNEEDIRWCRKIFQRGSVFASSRFVIRVRSDEKKKRKKELFKSRTTLVQRERERERGKKITQHKAEKWISSKARSFKFLFFFFSFKRIRDLLTFVHKEECIRQVYEVSNLSDLPFHGENEFLHCGKWRDKVKLWGWIFMKAEIRRIIGKFIK